MNIQIITSLLVATTFVLIANSETCKKAELNFVRPLEFKFRDALEKSPKIDSRIKTLVFDDRTLHRLGAPELTSKDWQVLLKALSALQPKRILIDKIFAVAPPDLQLDPPAPGNGSTVILAGGNSSDSAIPFRTELELNFERYRSETYFASADDWERWPGGSQRFAYGPADAFLQLFSGAGHINYDLFGRIRPLAKISDKYVLPHLSVSAADTIRVTEGRLYLNDHLTPVNQEGLLQVNFPAMGSMASRFLSLAPFLEAARRGNSSLFAQHIRPGDYVLILPLFFTGNTDFKETPIGTIPAGIVHFATINSVLQNAWLHELPGRTAAILIFSVIGVMIGFLARPLSFFIVKILLIGVSVVGAMLLFSHQGLILPWVFPVLALFTGGMLSFIYRSWQRDRIATSLQSSFHGLVPEKVLSQYIASPDKIINETQELTLTVMFIDIVGFSAFSSKESPPAVFRQLKHYIGLCSSIVHEYDGIIDKTMGDGLLAFFGYVHTGRKQVHAHAEAAIQAAVKIQRAAMEEYLRLEDDQQILPLRIGVNTARVFLGNLGSPPRIDFTIIGDGVNFAQRLESTCTPFHINISQSTLDSGISYSESSPGIVAKSVEIKHFHETFDVFQLNPFHDSPKHLEWALRTFEMSNNKFRRFVRRPVLEPEKIKVVTPVGEAILLDYSRSGFSVQMPIRLEDLQVLSLTLKADRTFNENLAQVGINQITVEVRWCRPCEGGFLSGLLTRDLPQEQQEALFDALRNLFRIQKEH